MLLGMDVIGPEKMYIDPAGKQLIVGSYQNTVCPLQINAVDAVRNTVRTTKRSAIQSHIIGFIELRVRRTLPEGSYLFQPTYSSTNKKIAAAGGTYAHIVDARVLHI